MQGPYERKNQTIDQGTILELNVIGRKDYDNVKLFQSYIPDKEKKTIDESEDILKIKSDLGSDGQSLQDLLKDEFCALEKKYD